MEIILKDELKNIICKTQQGTDAIRTGNYKTCDSADEMMEDIIKEARAEFEINNMKD